jgi:hypothetical protein
VLRQLSKIWSTLLQSGNDVTCLGEHKKIMAGTLAQLAETEGFEPSVPP